MKVIKFLAVIIVVSAFTSCNKTLTKKSLKTDIDSVSYALGIDMSNKFKANLPDVNKEIFVAAFLNGMDSINLLMTNEESAEVLQVFFEKRRRERVKKFQEEKIQRAEKEFADVKAEGIKFLEENKSKKGVHVTESGLQYIVLKEGKGEKPTATSKVKVHYHGTLIDGTVFDSSVERKQPSEFYVNRVIKGWTEGLQLMSVGSKYKFFIPQELAYGATPRQGGKIKPFMPLIFEVELLEIIK